MAHLSEQLKQLNSAFVVFQLQWQHVKLSNLHTNFMLGEAIKANFHLSHYKSMETKLP